MPTAFLEWVGALGKQKLRSTKDTNTSFLTNRDSLGSKAVLNKALKSFGTENLLHKAANCFEDDKLQRFVRARGTEWHFIKPSAPHEGGVWEAAVKQMKRVIGVQKYSFQGMATLLAGVEACLNSRPLCKMSDDWADEEPLTPAHFLIGRPLRLPMNKEVGELPSNINSLYAQMQFQLQSFWKQWSSDYLQSLAQLPKWHSEQENLRIGQLVIIKADNIAPTYWSLGKILQTYPGSDGKVRSVLLKTQTGQLERSIRKVCVLPTDIELSYWKTQEVDSVKTAFQDDPPMDE